MLKSGAFLPSAILPRIAANRSGCGVAVAVDVGWAVEVTGTVGVNVTDGAALAVTVTVAAGGSRVAVDDDRVFAAVSPLPAQAERPRRSRHPMISAGTLFRTGHHARNRCRRPERFRPLDNIILRSS
jgi:hypothetical protein